MHQLTPDLAESMSRASRVVFIDASAEGAPGTLTCRRIGAGDTPPAPFCHHLTPDSLLALCKVLYGRWPEAFVVSVTGESFDFGETLSAAVSAALPRLTKQVVECLERKH